jgi:tetratricopeptide (TPR) repeat protein
MTGAKLGAVVMSALVVMYLALLGQQGVLFFNQPNPVSKAMGVFILILPVFGAWGIWSELRFGIAVEKLAKQLEAEGAWPRFKFSVLPSGRANKSEALQEFPEYQEQTRLDPENWRKWFALGLAYDACGNRKLARKAMRRAIALNQR